MWPVRRPLPSRSVAMERKAGGRARALCPACRRINEKLPAGIVTVRGNLVLCQPCSDAFRADLLPRGLAVGGGDGEAVPGDVDGRGA